jgi:hypothetical protein
MLLYVFRGKKVLRINLQTPFLLLVPSSPPFSRPLSGGMVELGDASP